MLTGGERSRDRNSLLSAENHQRTDRHCAPGWNQRRHQRDSEKDEGRGHERYRVEGRHAEQHALEESHDENGYTKAQRNSGRIHAIVFSQPKAGSMRGRAC